MEFDFDDIRPYEDAEVESVLANLLQDREFLNAISVTRLAQIYRWFPALARNLVKRRLAPFVGKLHSVADFQLEVESYMDANLKSTSSALTTAGVGHLDSNRSYVFICNHRDIVMDPALCNLILHRAGRDTFRIAIGDNLLSKPFAEHLMRINKSFLVKRRVEGRKQKFLELQKLSAYIRKSIMLDGQSVWIAHREGRAKDGIDRTDAALLKMLALSAPKEESFADRIRDIHLVPVAVSYQWDPCDQMKARELAATRRDGHYVKGEFEDIQSIALGIQGWKGHIQVAFGDEIRMEVESADQLAMEIDRQIISMYAIQSSHLAAWKILYGELPDEFSIDMPHLAEATDLLHERLRDLADDEQKILLEAYANPIHSRLKLAKTAEESELI